MVRTPTKDLAKVFRMADNGSDLHAAWQQCGEPTTYKNVVRAYKVHQQEVGKSTTARALQLPQSSQSAARPPPRGSALESPGAASGRTGTALAVVTHRGKVATCLIRPHFASNSLSAAGHHSRPFESFVAIPSVLDMPETCSKRS